MVGNMRGRPSLYSERQWAWLIEKYREGYSLQEIADFIGFSRSGLVKKFEKRGITLRGQLSPLREQKQEFNELMED